RHYCGVALQPGPHELLVDGPAEPEVDVAVERSARRVVTVERAQERHPRGLHRVVVLVVTVIMKARSPGSLMHRPVIPGQQLSPGANRLGASASGLTHQRELIGVRRHQKTSLSSLLARGHAPGRGGSPSEAR